MNAQNELQSNAILTGNINCYCLACDKFLLDKRIATLHITSVSHSERFSSVPYLEKYKDHFIKKFNAGYFCECCNELMASTTSVNVHTIDTEHRQKRGAYSLKPLGLGVLAFDDVVINEDAWHSFIEETCFLCDIDLFGSKDVHKEDATHVLNLIRCPITFGDDDAMYREVGPTVQCLTCNKLLPLNTINQHFAHLDHRKIYDKCKIFTRKNEENTEMDAEYKNLNDKDPKNNNDTIYSADDDNRKVTEFVNAIDAYEINSVDINFETEKAFCRICLKVIVFNHDEIMKHIEEHRKVDKPDPAARYPNYIHKEKYCIRPDYMDDDFRNFIDIHDIANNVSEKDTIGLKNRHSKVDEEANHDEPNDFNDSSTSESVDPDLGEVKIADIHSFATDNRITYNPNNYTAFCRICQVRLPSSLKSMEEHVNGGRHTKNVADSQVKVKKTLQKLIMRRFVKSLIHLKFPYYGFIINREYFVEDLSFLLLVKSDFPFHLKCLICQREVAEEEFTLQNHVNMCSIPSGKELYVITSVKSEFIREVQPGSYHCGNCNLVVSGWEEMETHIKSTEHVENKIPFFFK